MLLLFQLGYLNDHLLIRFIVHVLSMSVSSCLCVLLSLLVLRMECGGFDHCFSIYFSGVTSLNAVCNYFFNSSLPSCLEKMKI